MVWTSTLSSANGLQAVHQHQCLYIHLARFSVFLGTARPCSWSWLSNNDCQDFKKAPVSNTVKAREAEGKAEICGSLQGFYCESETRKDICTVQCS